MKTVTKIGLVFCFSLFLGLAAAPQVQAEEHYIYKDPHGNLVISNQRPPAGSNVLRKIDLPDATDPQVQQSQEPSDTQLNGHSEDPAKPSKNK